MTANAPAPPPTLEPLMTAADVAEVLGLSVREVFRRAASGEIPRAYKLGHHTSRWKPTEIQAYLDRLRN
jgi:predicted DNA-binding transcriptional regulator AlpA